MERLEAEVPEAVVVRPVEDRVERVAFGVDAGEETIADQPELRAAADEARERLDALLGEPLVDLAGEQAGVEVWVWFFPLADDPERAADVAGRALQATGGRGLILDVEKPYRGNVAGCRRLVSASLDQLGEDQGIAVTSYPLARYHRPMPWSEMVAGTGMPQTYTIAPNLARVAAAEWRARGHTSIVPIGPAYGPNSEGRLMTYLRLAYLEDGAPTVDGIGIWSWPQMSSSEWRTLEQVASWW